MLHELARHGIAADEELTIEYALSTMITSWRMTCRCGSPPCRSTIGGDDRHPPDLQKRYRDHFSPFINERIRASHL